MRILIAEDDQVSRNFLSRFLGKFGECDLVVDGLETIDAFLMAMKDGDPYQLICLDIMMPKVDGVRTLKAIRALEKQYEVAQENRVKIIMTTALAEAQMVHTAFEYGCEAYAAKPIDTKKLIEVMDKLGLLKETSGEEEIYGLLKKTKFLHKGKMESKKNEPAIEDQDAAKDGEDGYFRSVSALPDYQLEVSMETGTTIHFDFRPRLDTARFGMLRDEALFQNVHTDGNYLIFEKEGKMPVKITASEFMDLVLIDRRK